MPDATGSDPTAQGQKSNWQKYYESCATRWSSPRYALDTRFVQLTLLVDQGEDTQGVRWQASSERYKDLQDVLVKVPEQALVLLGPPGSGKSTLLRHFELECTRAVLNETADESITTAPLTFFIQLNDFKAKIPNDPMPSPSDWLAQRWAEQWPQLPPLDELLREARLTLLLDALNEIPYPGPEPVNRWKDFLRHLVQDYPGTRVVFTCRSLDYSAQLSSKDLTVPQVRIDALSDEQIRDFLEVYCPAFADTLWANLKDAPQLDVLRSPYYLKLLVLQTVAGEIPAGRAALFTGFVRQALKREVLGDAELFQEGELLDARDRQRLTQASAWKTPFMLPERGKLIPKLSQLAFQMQTHRSVSEGGQVRIDYDDAVNMLADPRADDLLKAGGALGMLEQDWGCDEVLFVHQLLQEYFAARQLARASYPEFVAQEWRVDRVLPSLDDTIAMLSGSDPLPLLPSSGWEETTILASAMVEESDKFLTDIMAQQLPLAGRCAAEGEAEVSEQLKDTLRRALVARTQDPEADLRARIEAGLALGGVGDPRFVRQEGPGGPYLLPPLIEVFGGRYTIGSDNGQEDDERPAHEVELEAFLMGQFPVTNAEWAMFLKAGGYEQERWWETEEAKAWRRGENTAEGPKENWRYWRSQFQADVELIHELLKEGRIIPEVADQWNEFATMPDEEFEGVLDERWPGGRHTQPSYWNYANFNNSQQPVVGICWHEARAYCAWLSAQTTMIFRLPTEAEWEAAARGFETRRYAYGEDFDPFRCNVLETHIRRTIPVGVFPGGNTPEDLMDMTGNVWEWTSSLYQPYPYRSDDGREQHVSGAGRRVPAWRLLGPQPVLHARHVSQQSPSGRPFQQHWVSGGAVVPHLLLILRSLDAA